VPIDYGQLKKKAAEGNTRGKSEEKPAEVEGPRICIQLIQIYNRLYIRVASILLSGGYPACSIGTHKELKR